MAKILKYTDHATGNLVEVDITAGRMLSTDRDGKRVETKIVENGDYAKELAIQASDMDNQHGYAQNGMRLLDLGTSDVQQAAPMPNYAAGYKNADGVAEVVAPVVMTGKPSSKFYTWDVLDAFQAVDNLAAAPGGVVAEISPRLSNSTYATTEFAVGGFVPTEVQSAADSPLNPMVQLVRRLQQALYIGRETRVYNTVMTAGSYAAAQKTDLVAAGVAFKWNGGASSDPIKNIHDMIESSPMEPTGIVQRLPAQRRGAEVRGEQDRRQADVEHALRLVGHPRPAPDLRRAHEGQGQDHGPHPVHLGQRRAAVPLGRAGPADGRAGHLDRVHLPLGRRCHHGRADGGRLVHPHLLRPEPRPQGRDEGRRHPPGRGGAHLAPVRWPDHRRCPVISRLAP
jgi:hypothetical protein